MVFETIIIAAVAGAMLGWNVHVMRTTGVCCPPPQADGAPRSSSRGTPSSSQLRRRRKRSSSSRSRDREAEAQRKGKARTAVGSAGRPTKSMAMDPVQEQQEEVQAPACDTDLATSEVATEFVNVKADGDA